MTAIHATSRGDDGRPVAATDGKDILAILQKYDGRRGSLIAILEEIQLRYGYLPEEALRAVSERTGRSLVDIYGIATFYRSFSLKPRGEHLVCACLGTACHVRGAPGIVEDSSGSWESRREKPLPTGSSPWKRSTAWGPAPWGRWS